MPQRLWPLPRGLWLQPLHSRAVTIMLLVCSWSADSMKMHSTRISAAAQSACCISLGRLGVPETRNPWSDVSPRAPRLRRVWPAIDSPASTTAVLGWLRPCIAAQHMFMTGCLGV